MRLIPFAKVEDAEVEVTFRRSVLIPALNVVEAVVENVFVSARRVVDAVVSVSLTQTPLIEKHPPVRLNPFEAVEVAVEAPVRFR